MDTASPPITGRCNCGAVRYEVDEPFLDATYCHCTRCQRRTGAAASANAKAVPGSVHVTNGAELLASWQPADGWGKWFCSACGSAMFSRDPNDERAVGVRLGSVDGDPGVRPTARQFVAYAASWEPIPDDGLPRFAEGRS